ncbi:MAG: ester cyclase [Frankiaceae bacterium]|nr:ester cyclase [Frankiaceae bacterium]
MAHDYRALAERVYSIFERGAVDELTTVFAPGFIEHDELPGSTATNIDLVREWVQMSRTSMPDARYTIESVVGSGDDACCRVRLTGTHQGEMLGMPATGNKIDILLMDWVRLTADGQVAEHWGVMQEGALMAQLGVMAPQTIDLTTPATISV